METIRIISSGFLILIGGLVYGIGMPILLWRMLEGSNDPVGYVVTGLCIVLWFAGIGAMV